MTKTPYSVTNGRRCFLCFVFLWGMKTFVLMIVLMLLSACGLEQMGVGTHSGEDGIWRGPSYGKHMAGTCYAAGLDYPEGYDWRADPENGKVSCDLVLFADGVPVLKVPVGERNETSADKARHRIRSGCLYTDYTDGETTVFRKDGMEVARYAGAEEIMCMEVYDGKIHSLSRTKDSAGFVYRVDGELVLERSYATPYLHIDEHADSVRFFFSQEQRTASGDEMRYYHVADGIVRQVVVDSSISKVWDMRIIGGTIHMAVSFPDVSPVLIYGDKRETLDYISSQEVVSCTFCDSRRLCLNTRIRYSGDNLMTDILWFGGEEWVMYRITGTLSSVIVDNEGYAAVINSSAARSGLIFDGGKAFAMPEGYGVYSKDCMARRDSVLIVGLTSDGGKPPLIWKAGDPDTLRINGPVTCLQ